MKKQDISKAIKGNSKIIPLTPHGIVKEDNFDVCKRFNHNHHETKSVIPKNDINVSDSSHDDTLNLRKIGFNDAIDEVEKMINDEINYINNLIKDNPKAKIINSWNTRITTLNEFKQKLNSMRKK